MQIDGAPRQMHPMHFPSAPLSPAFSILRRRHRADSSSKDVVHHPLCLSLSLPSCLSQSFSCSSMTSHGNNSHLLVLNDTRQDDHLTPST